MHKAESYVGVKSRPVPRKHRKRRTYYKLKATLKWTIITSTMTAACIGTGYLATKCADSSPAAVE